MLNKKEWQILEVLYQQTAKFLTSKEIAGHIGISDKTVRKYSKNISLIVAERGARLSIKQGMGYCLTIENPIVFSLFYETERKKRINPQKVSDLEEAKDRQHYILSKLFFENQQLSVVDIEEQLFLSITTVLNILKDLRVILRPYNLRLDNSLSTGIEIQGSEKDKRKFMLEYFFSRKFDQSLMPFIGEYFFNGKLNLSELTIIILDETREASLNLTDYIVHNLVLHIALTITRLEYGNSLESIDFNQEIEETDEFYVAKKIISRLEKIYQVEFPETEAKYIALHLLTKKTNQVKNTEGNLDLEHQLQQSLNELAERFNGLISVDQTLIQGLLIHFEQLVIRLKNKVNIQNPLLNDIVKNYPDESGTVIDVMRKIPIIANYTISKDEWAYIILHILASIERYYQKQKANVLVVCATGVGSAQMLKNRLEHEFGSQIHIKDVISYYDLNDSRVNGIDFIISSINLDNLYLPIPTVVVNVLLGKDDVENVRKFIWKDSQTDSGESAVVSIIPGEIFTECFSPQKFLYFEDSIEKKNLLNAMVHLLEYEGDRQVFEREILKDIKMRDSFGATVFEEILAIPHPTRAYTETEQIVVAILPNGVAWEDTSANVEFVFLVSPSKHSNKLLMQVTHALVALVQNKKFQKALHHCKSFEEFKGIFSEIFLESKRK